MSSLSAWRWWTLVALCYGILAPLPGSAAAEAPAACCHSTPGGKRPGDQFWLICTRHLGCDGMTANLPAYRVQYFAQDAWHGAHATMFLGFDDPARPTVIYVHGNRYTASDAISSGWQAYHALTRCLPAEQHIRFVVWSWPSDKQGGPIRDARLKASRTLIEGYYLSRLMTEIGPEVPTSVLGYSYGGRVALGAAHLAGGGQLAGYVLPQPPHQRLATYRVAMLAAGVEDDALLPGQRFQMAMSRTDHLLNLYNRWDPILKRYRVVDKFERPTAMGYAGVYGESALGAAAARISDCDVSGIIGKTHDEQQYFASEYVMQRVRATVLGANATLPPHLAKN